MNQAMTYILDMVHHNPGEPPFESAFLDPAHLGAYGYNGQVFKHINCIATYAATGVDCFPPDLRNVLGSMVSHLASNVKSPLQRRPDFRCSIISI